MNLGFLFFEYANGYAGGHGLSVTVNLLRQWFDQFVGIDYKD